jgi:uncharacterized protein (TIGR02646 family)
MRTIKKQNSPAYEKWVHKHSNASYSSIEESIRNELKQSLSYEQLGLCCYCCCKLDEQPRPAHIEHFKPQSSYPQLSLDYQNMHLSCTANLSHNYHCGHKKANTDPKDCIISPLSEDCTANFRYDRMGKIHGETEIAAKTIEKLGLNVPSLIAARKMVIQTIELDPDAWGKNETDAPAFLNVIEYFQAKA